MAEHLGWWSPPIKVAGRKSGITHDVSHATKAAEMLLSDGPASKGPKHLEAPKAILHAMQNALDATAKAKARAAFEAAAKEAGING